MSGVEIGGDWIDIPFNPADINGSELHVKNKAGGQLERAIVMDELCKGLRTKVRLDRALHGINSRGNKASLLYFSIRLVGNTEKRRFQRVDVRIRFKNEMHPGIFDPTVSAFWPNGDFYFNETTVREETRVGFGVKSDFGIAETVGLDGVSTKAAWVKTRLASIPNRATLHGVSCIDKPEEAHETPENSVHFTLLESTTLKGGVVPSLRTAILLEHEKTDSDRFSANFRVDAQVGSTYVLTKGFLKLFGKLSELDPVYFDLAKHALLPRSATTSKIPTPGSLASSESLDSVPDLSVYKPPV